MSEWSTAPLGDVCLIVGGGTPSRAVPEYFGGEIPWITPTDVTKARRRYLDRGANMITSAGLANSSARLLPARSVLLTSRATIGYTAINTVPVATNQGFANFVCRSRIHPEYLAYWLEWSRDTLISLASGATFKEINKSTLARLQIPLPPLDEQLRIVDTLDRVAEISRRADEARIKARAAIPALFLETFGDPGSNPNGWPQVSLGEIINRISGGKNIEAGSGASDYRIMKVSAVTSGAFRPEESKPAPDDHVPAPEHHVRDGDFLFSRANTSELVGAVAIAHDPPKGLLLPDKIWRIEWDGERVVGSFAYSLLRSAELRRIIALASSGTSSSMKNISQAKLKCIRVPLPPILLQSAFVERRDRIEALARHLDAAAAKSAAMSAAVSAEIFR